jgi:hypothetical protein
VERSFALGVPLAVALGVLGACGSDGDGSTFRTDAGGPPVTGPEFPNDNSPECDSLACRQVDCGGTVSTTVTGKVTAPNGTLPLYNAIVYVPQEPLAPLAEGVTCDRCGSVSGKPLVSTLTKVDGTFELTNMPSGRDVPLVVQVGKWRRQITIADVPSCKTTALDPETTRLPKKRSEGDIPRIAVTTGVCDQLACLLPKLGLDASEFTASDGPGRLHLFRGAPFGSQAAPAPTGTRDAKELYSSADSFSKYDMLLLSCECSENADGAKTQAARDALYEYVSRGGRVFASHFHYYWAQTPTSPLASVANWDGHEGNPETGLQTPFSIDTSFDKGRAFADWLMNVGASKAYGEIPIAQPRENVGSVKAGAQAWVTSKPKRIDDDVATKYLSINAPVGEPLDKQCGKFVYADMHLYAGDEQPADTALPDDDFPASCSKDLTDEEKALAFLFFDLSSCVQDDKAPPRPPIK